MRAILFAGILLALSASCAFAQVISIPDLNHSIAECAYDGDEMLSLVVLPDGSGDPFTHAYLPSTSALGPQIVDATIMLQVLDTSDVPIANFPAEDLWLDSLDGGMVACTGGTIADVNTDSQGRTFWANPLRAGGHSEARLQVYINGDSAIWDGAPIHVKSPDLDGNLLVNLVDVGLFASDFASGYAYRSDFNQDAALNLADVRILAGGIGDQCP